MDAVLDALLNPFGYSFMLRALIVSVLVGVICPILGTYVVTRGLGFMGDALAHAVLPGMVIAFMLGISPFLGAVPVGIAVAVLIGYLSRRMSLSEDTTIGILFAGLFALGLVLMTMASGLPVDIEDLLLGQVLAVSSSDVAATLGLATTVMVVLYAFHKELVFNSFDPTGAKVIGLPTTALDYLLLVMLALVIIIALQAVGIVLVIAMLITPSATAFLLVRRFTTAMGLGAFIGAGSAVVGLYASFYMNLPSGPAMTLVATAVFIIVALARRKVA
jgi:ABC-type Mn2+/Zn2+ transport system permease subunit